MNVYRCWTAACALAISICAVSCARREAPSRIVQALERAGAGELGSSSSLAIESWFRDHRQTAVAVDAQCRPVRERSPAGWHDGTEGRVCQAARNVAMFVQERRQSSGQKFQAGWK